MTKLLTIFAVLVPALALGEGNIVVQTTAQFEQSVIGESGEAETRLVPVTTVVPGDEVIYTITFTNKGEVDADRVMVTDPVPAEMRYIAGSAFGGGTDIVFSVDGGMTFGPAADLVVVEADGSQRSARPDDYTHIRWTMRNPLQPGKRGYARFRAELR